MESGIDRLAEVKSHLHELSNAVLVKLCERIVLKDLCVIVSVKELTGIVTAEAEGHLSKVVGSEAEEVSFLCNLISGERSSRNFNHCANFILEVSACCGDFCVSSFNNKLLNILKLFNFANERNHDFRNDLPVRMSL